MLTVPRINTLSQFNEKHLMLPINITPWEEYSDAPNACAKLAYADGIGLVIQLVSNETQLLATVTERDGMVCRDSCMEAFIDFAPKKEIGYINLELNPLATLYEAVGKLRNGRRFVKELGAPKLTPVTTISADGWKAELIVTESHIAAIYGEAPKSGSKIKANFYCCADGKSKPFYATAFKVEALSPDYHRPEYFAELTIE